MAKFVVSSSVKRLGDQGFLAIVSAVPYGPEVARERDERTRVCGTIDEAREAGLDLASELSYEINARGDRVVDIEIRT